jgi:ribosomal protein L37AE/L43A
MAKSIMLADDEVRGMDALDDGASCILHDQLLSYSIWDHNITLACPIEGCETKVALETRKSVIGNANNFLTILSSTLATKRTQFLRSPIVANSTEPCPACKTTISAQIGSNIYGCLSPKCGKIFSL